MFYEACELVPTERVAIVVRCLMQGRALTTREVADMTGISSHGAYQMLSRMSRVVPVYQVDRRTWAMLSE